MAKAKTPSYVLELELQVNKRQRDFLEKKMRIAKAIYNTCLGEALKRLKAVRADKTYRELVAEKGGVDRVKALRGIELAYGYSEYQLHAFVVASKHHFGSLGIDECQKLATRAFQAVEKINYGQADRVHFKSQLDNISIEGKSNNSTIKRKEGYITFGRGNVFDYLLKPNDVYAHLALMDRTKYCRIIRREIRGKQRYFVQFVQEGYPPQKRNRKLIAEDNLRVGLDIGTSTIAIVSDERVTLRELAPEINEDAKELRRIERAMDRSKRATNPDNFKENGVAKIGARWIFSKRYLKLKAKRKDRHRKIARKRKQAHEQLANDILALGSDIRVETMRFQSLQKRAKKTTRNKQNGKINKKKRFGKSIQVHGPALLLEIVARKLGYQNRPLQKIDTCATKASQFNHATGEYTKKQLNERWNADILGVPIQRDLYSGFLIGNTTDSLDSVDVDLCNRKWENFVKLHNQEVERLRCSQSKTLRWFVA
ncbi:MAG: transposase [Trichococcus flocculiformis]|jgi:hypothetical protein|uniref:transposase n=1 Tax=Trichococcus shcherbakoviae TaxID=2094020 RepID=UPI001B5030EA|nr:transposase [Trichococcus shcherbakoviae]MBP7129182.1 hypothetical protein [Trichococcus sp.]MBP9976466.1 hypothetical protein [Trichococcus sp.]